MALGCFAVVGAWGQTSTDGAIGGFVVDPGGAALKSATVQASNAATGFKINTTTGANGGFLLARLPAGVYKVTVVCPRFERLVMSGVTVEVGGVTPLSARMKLGNVSTSVTVTATPEVSATGVASTMTADEIDRLPIDGRRWQTFALLTPTANADPDADGLLSFRGLPVTQNSVRIDGADADQGFGSVPLGAGSESDPEDERDSNRAGFASGYGRHSGAAYTFSMEAVREFRVSGQNYSALYGHAAGGVVTTISKSGTNALHGSAFYLLRDSALNAANPYSVATRYTNGAVTSSVVKPHDIRQQYGGSIGGPAVRDRLFYFYAFDQQRRGFPVVSSPLDPNFYSLTETQTALLATRGVSTVKVNAALSYLDSLTGTTARRWDQTIHFGKLDWKVTENQRISVQYNHARSSAPGGARSAPVVGYGVGSLGSSYAHVDALAGRWLWTPSSMMSNEVRAQFARDFQFETAQKPLAQEPAVGPGGYAPEVAIGPEGLTFGTPSSLGRKAYPDERKVQLADLVTWVRGRHQLQAGADVSLVHDRIDALTNAEGTFRYDSGTTGGHAGGLVDWITDYAFNVNAYPNGGCPSITSPVHLFCFRSFSQSFGGRAVAFDTQEWAGYIEDMWSLRLGLTVHAGVRYEYELLPLPQQPNLALDAVFGSAGATSIFPEDRNNFGPRVGVAWEPFGEGRGVVHIGYGLFYGRLPGATVRKALIDTALPSSATHVRITPATVTNCPQMANQGFGYACSFVTAPPAAVAATTSAMVFDRRFRLPAVQQGSVAVERAVGAGMVASATYLVNLDRQLLNSTDINIAPSTDLKTFQIEGGTGIAGVHDEEKFVVPAYTQRVDANFGPVTDIVSNTNASYNALVVAVRRRSRSGLEFRASWTWSKAIDFGQSGAIPRQNAQFDPFDVRYDKGLSALNHPQKIVASAVWQPRLSTESAWLRRAASGWLIAPLFSAASGRPYSYNILGGTRLTGGHESINGAGGAVYLPTVGRDTLRLPFAYVLDLRVSRAVRISERVRVQAIAEAFNLTNHVNPSSVMQRAFLVGKSANGVTPLLFQNAATVAAEGLNVYPFGTVTSADATGARERRLQLGLRMEF
ncbi:MAG TPA: TonB-dependent receptor [Edaphobacter sp.]|nr:TonB-dependent receptor [Edaphobacter sp.]HEU5339618.1 TonB-dependent receptor [Edaphobacter sp.]